MRENQTNRVLLAISICGFTCMSCSFIFMPFESVGYLPGLLFWGGLLIGGVLQIVLEIRRRAFFKEFVEQEKGKKPRCGLLSFGSNRVAAIVDKIMIISFIAMILAFIITEGYGSVCYLFIATTILSFCLHCIFNGRIYFYTKSQIKLQQVLEQKKTKTIDKGEGENEKG